LSDHISEQDFHVKMALVGADFARSHMEGKGWSSGEGLGRHGQGIVDALKPKLKFDQTGVGHNRAEEFEFHWWDHVFNKAAKSVKVEDNQGDVTVNFNCDKSELSTKKMRRKAQKEIKNKLYSNFVKSGTLTGGKMEEEEGNGDAVVEVTDLSKMKELTDDELVAACGGRTAHKGSRHGHKMTAKLDRIAEAEREYMEKYNIRIAEDKNKKKKKKKKRHEENNVVENSVVENSLSVDKPKKKKRAMEIEEQLVVLTEPPVKKKKKHKKNKDKSCEDTS